MSFTNRTRILRRTTLGVLVVVVLCALAALFALEIGRASSGDELVGNPQYLDRADLEPSGRSVSEDPPFRRPDCVVPAPDLVAGDEVGLAVWRATLAMSESAAGADTFRALPLLALRRGGASPSSEVTAAANCSEWQMVFCEPLASVRKAGLVHTASWSDLSVSATSLCYVRTLDGWASAFYFAPMPDQQSYAVWYYMVSPLGINSVVDATERLTGRVGDGPRRVVPARSPRGLVWLAGTGSGGDFMTPLYNPSSDGLELSYSGSPIAADSVVPLSALYRGTQYRANPN